MDDEKGSNGHLLKLSYPICLDRTLFNESFQVTHATPSTVCQKITCKPLQHSRKVATSLSAVATKERMWTSSITKWVKVEHSWTVTYGDSRETAGWHDSRCDLRKLWNFRKPFLTCLTCLRFSLIIEAYQEISFATSWFIYDRCFWCPKPPWHTSKHGIIIDHKHLNTSWIKWYPPHQWRLSHQTGRWLLLGGWAPRYSK